MYNIYNMYNKNFKDQSNYLGKIFLVLSLFFKRFLNFQNLFLISLLMVIPIFALYAIIPVIHSALPQITFTLFCVISFLYFFSSFIIRKSYVYDLIKKNNVSNMQFNISILFFCFSISFLFFNLNLIITQILVLYNPEGSSFFKFENKETMIFHKKAVVFKDNEDIFMFYYFFLIFFFISFFLCFFLDFFLKKDKNFLMSIMTITVLNIFFGDSIKNHFFESRPYILNINKDLGEGNWILNLGSIGDQSISYKENTIYYSPYNCYKYNSFFGDFNPNLGFNSSDIKMNFIYVLHWINPFSYIDTLNAEVFNKWTDINTKLFSELNIYNESGQLLSNVIGKENISNIDLKTNIFNFYSWEYSLILVLPYFFISLFSIIYIFIIKKQD